MSKILHILLYEKLSFRFCQNKSANDNKVSRIIVFKKKTTNFANNFIIYLGTYGVFQKSNTKEKQRFIFQKVMTFDIEARYRINSVF